MIVTGRGTSIQNGFSLIEMLVATVIVMASLGPAINALQSARLAAEIHSIETELHYRLQGRSEEILAEPFQALLNAAEAAGDITIATTYSDPPGTANRIVSYLSFYDLANTDGDDDFFTIDDPNSDSDNNPYTGQGAAIAVAWLRVEIEGTTHSVETLSRH